MCTPFIALYCSVRLATKCETVRHSNWVYEREEDEPHQHFTMKVKSKEKSKLIIRASWHYAIITREKLPSVTVTKPFVCCAVGVLSLSLAPRLSTCRCFPDPDSDSHPTIFFLDSMLPFLGHGWFVGSFGRGGLVAQ